MITSVIRVNWSCSATRLLYLICSNDGIRPRYRHTESLGQSLSHGVSRAGRIIPVEAKPINIPTTAHHPLNFSLDIVENTGRLRLRWCNINIFWLYNFFLLRSTIL